MSQFTVGWNHGRGHEQLAAARRTELERPFKGNDPALMKPTKCTVLRPFFVAGRRVEPGETVELQRHDALSLAALRKVAILTAGS